MLKLCEVIALVTGRKTEAQKRITELHQLSQKPTLFAGSMKTYQPRDEADPETLPEEKQAIQLRVDTLLSELRKSMANLYDLVLTQDTGNTIAKSDVILKDGKVLAKDVPVTSLLYLEKQLDDLKKFYVTLPILDPTKIWTYDADSGCYRSVTVKTRTKQNKVPVVLYHATDKHPAQVTMVDENKIVGDYTSIEFSSALTAAKKASLLEKVSTLKDAVVLARERANQTNVEVKKIGEEVFQFLHE